MTYPSDVLDHLAGIQPGSNLDALRRRRAQSRDNAQASYTALFAPSGQSTVPLLHRLAIAAYVAAITGSEKAAEHYGNRLAALDASVASTIAREAEDAGQGPYGTYPSGPLSDEDRPGQLRNSAPELVAALGQTLAAGLDHAHLLVLHPRDANSAALQRLIAAGWTTAGIVTLSQIIAFVSFQARVASGLTVLHQTAPQPVAEGLEHA